MIFAAFFWLILWYIKNRMIKWEETFVPKPFGESDMDNVEIRGPRRRWMWWATKFRRWRSGAARMRPPRSTHQRGGRRCSHGGDRERHGGDRRGGRRGPCWIRATQFRRRRSGRRSSGGAVGGVEMREMLGLGENDMGEGGAWVWGRERGAAWGMRRSEEIGCTEKI